MLRQRRGHRRGGGSSHRRLPGQVPSLSTRPQVWGLRGAGTVSPPGRGAFLHSLLLPEHQRRGLVAFCFALASSGVCGLEGKRKGIFVSFREVLQKL